MLRPLSSLSSLSVSASHSFSLQICVLSILPVLNPKRPCARCTAKEEEKRTKHKINHSSVFCEYKYVMREENERKMFNLKMRYHCHFIERQQIPLHRRGRMEEWKHNTLCFVGRARCCVAAVAAPNVCNIVLVPCSYILNSNRSCLTPSTSSAQHFTALRTRKRTKWKRFNGGNLFTFLADILFRNQVFLLPRDEWYVFLFHSSLRCTHTHTRVLLPFVCAARNNWI